MVANKAEAAAIFADIIKADRNKRKNEDLANQMLGSSGRKTTGPGSAAAKDRRGNNGPSLASRMGVTKLSQRATSIGSRTGMGSRTTSERSIDTSNTNTRLSRVSNLARTASDSRLDRKNRLYEGLITNQDNSKDQVILHRQQPPVLSTSANGDISVRGMGGPYIVVASNFAPGTTAADIEAVIAPVGGELLNCRLVAANPTVIVEMVFADKVGAENVIATFNNKKADGRLLYVYMKDPVPSQTSQSTQQRQAPRPRAAQQQQQQQHQQQPQQQQFVSQDDEVMEVEEGGDYQRDITPRQDTQPKRAEPSYQDGTHGFVDDNTQREEVPSQPHNNWRGDNRDYRGGDYRRDNRRDERWEDRRYNQQQRRDRFEPGGRLYSDNLFPQRGRDQRYRQ